MCCTSLKLCSLILLHTRDIEGIPEGDILEIGDCLLKLQNIQIVVVKKFLGSPPSHQLCGCVFKKKNIILSLNIGLITFCFSFCVNTNLH